MTVRVKNGAPVRFEGVTVRYEEQTRPAVSNVRFDIEPGEFVVLLGPSGCGKSTLLRTVNRLIEPQSGHVFVDGTDNQSVDATELRRSIGYVIQAVGLFANMTIAQNIAVVPDLLHWERARTDTRIDELLTLVDLEPATYRNRRPAELSGGEQQRVGVARAIAAQPRVLLMDEPFGAVDAIVRANLQRETKRIASVLETTILFVTHDVDEALQLADRIVVMQAGEVVQYDTPLALLTDPKTPFVAQLLDTHDIVRRLQLMRVADAMLDEVPPPGAPEIDGGATLRESLILFLRGADRLSVTRDGQAVGTLEFDRVRSAIRKTA
ncbi:MAG: ABC transporter ATP-binding protein [Candidatus Eremiobacteraeota bacterium]|nr:ABC transporter ATP-binding protein [Candidatus Eremiobacteraeota bacterium]